MQDIQFEIYQKKVIIKIHDRICETSDELLASELCREIITRCVNDLARRKSLLINVFPNGEVNDAQIQVLIKSLQHLSKSNVQLLPHAVEGSEGFLKDLHLFNDFIEHLYNYWRNFERFIIIDSTGKDLDKRPYRAFHSTIEHLTHLIRWTYRDISEHITNSHPRIYRQIIAGAEVAVISSPREVPMAEAMQKKLKNVPMIRQILMYPPLILNPPMNKRSGKFERVKTNPLDGVEIKQDEWLCYPMKVGTLTMLVYFHKKFFELGLSLCNLFKLADDEDLNHKPDAIYLFGVEKSSIEQFGSFPTIFYDDEPNQIFYAAVPNDDEFGYFGYLKKMILTLHNIIMMKRGRLPFHGAMVRLIMKGNRDKTILFIGDTGAGKSETLEAFLGLGQEYIQDIIVIADDMGSLEIDKNGDVIGYGTEVGAFLRLDDLQPGYALGQIDRAIIMNANQINARIIIPVTSFETIIKGHKLDVLLYANNYEEIDEDRPLIERFATSEEAFKVFKEGAVMSKGTTTTHGIVHSYFANIFGPPQYKELHEPLAQKYFKAFFDRGLFVGQMRTRLGVSGWERKGPEEAAKELLRVISTL